MYSLYNTTRLLASSGPPSSLLSTPLTNYHPRRHLQRLLEHRQGACPVASCSLAVWLSSDSSKELGVRGGPRGIFHLCFEACLFPMGRNNAFPPTPPVIPPPPTRTVPRTCWHLSHFDSRYNSLYVFTLPPLSVPLRQGLTYLVMPGRAPYTQ